ncbi:hypothetical protein [Halonotius sp. GCM10025705]
MTVGHTKAVGAAGRTTGSREWRVAWGVPAGGVADDLPRAAVDGGDDGRP